jgi:hypothetical protein
MVGMGVVPEATDANGWDGTHGNHVLVGEGD